MSQVIKLKVTRADGATFVYDKFSPNGTEINSLTAHDDFWSSVPVGRFETASAALQAVEHFVMPTPSVGARTIAVQEFIEASDALVTVLRSIMLGREHQDYPIPSVALDSAQRRYKAAEAALKTDLVIGTMVFHLSGAPGMVGKLVAIEDGWASVDLGHGWLKPQKFRVEHVAPVSSPEYQAVKRDLSRRG